MNNYDAKCARLHANLPIFRRHVSAAKSIIEEGLRNCERPFVAFSCGKDSAVMAHLIESISPGLPMRFVSSGETRLVHNVDDVLSWFRNRGAQIEEICFDRVFSEDWKDATWNEQRKAGNKDLQNINRGEFGAVFIGLRAKEGPNRARTLAMHRTPGLSRGLYRAKSGVLRICPLADFSEMDVAAYTAIHGIPMLDEYTEQGVSSRTTARLTGDAVRQGVVTRLRRKHPQKYSLLIRRFPELSEFSNIEHTSG